ncbi:PREDICTED: uncharacterized protein LOC107065330 isoform X2 [Polistes dominula]|uniref:Uncharacterized protein LOC107065330 isoform X2 n=1 Tax=Polistes dominula TaxID=743375 RepID=A0ABM1I2H1_POLDO|nr:PREDICTED: uncharacterized protein LOC107065330 isoform X2 [Polistes dominula]
MLVIQSKMKVTFLTCLLCCLSLRKSLGQSTNNILLGYQDSFGQYSFGYSTLNSARSEVKTVDGTIRGTYSYIDDKGMIQSTEYIADDNGFRVVATNLPQAPLPVQDTPEVIAARKDHLNAFLIAQQMAENDQDKNVYDNLESVIVDKEGIILTKDNQEINTKETENVLSSIDNNNATKINPLPVPVFKISFGNQILEPTDKTIPPANKDDQKS